MIRNCAKLFLAGIISSVIILSSGTTVSSVDIPELRLQISPPTQEMELNPGDQYSGSFQVQNTGSKEFKYKVTIEPYSVTDENYTPDYDSETTSSKIVNWITLSTTEGYVSAGNVVDVHYSISVPSDAPGGSQHAILLTELINPENESDQNGGTSISNVSRVGSIIYAKINGKTYETAEISDNTIKSFILTPPITASSLVKNTGNVDLKATYRFWVYSVFDDMTTSEPVYSNENNPDVRVVMADTERLNILRWEDTPRLGIFRVIQSVEVLGETSNTEKVVIVCPLWFAVIISILIILCIVWIAQRFRKK